MSVVAMDDVVRAYWRTAVRLAANTIVLPKGACGEGCE